MFLKNVFYCCQKLNDSVVTNFNFNYYDFENINAGISLIYSLTPINIFPLLKKMA